MTVTTISDRSKFRVLPLGWNFKSIERKTIVQKESPLILWNHRLDFDTRPEMFAKAILQLNKETPLFRLAITTDDQRDISEWVEMEKQLGNRLIVRKFLNREEYLKLLKEVDIVVSTKSAEMFGISVAEAICAGAIPVLSPCDPYRALYFRQFEFNDSEMLYIQIQKSCKQIRRGIDLGELNYFSSAMRDRAIAYHDWSNLREVYEDEFEDLMRIEK
jgi:glycosyltransferase involved in cell wall biosynthesis